MLRVATYMTSVVNSLLMFFFAAMIGLHGGDFAYYGVTIGVFCALVILGFLSWFHFFRSRTGAILLTVFTLILFISYPLFFTIEYIRSPDTSFYPFLHFLPILLTTLSIFLVWRSHKLKSDINKWAKYGMAVPVFMAAIFLILRHSIDFADWTFK